MSGSPRSSLSLSRVGGVLGALALLPGATSAKSQVAGEPWRIGPAPFAIDRGGARLAPAKADGPGEFRGAPYSVVLPGAGQLAQGQRRWLLYAAAEIATWGLLLDRRQDGLSLRDEYRDLAWTAARGGSGPPIDAGFEYFEILSKWERSGAFDADVGLPGVQPETDERTYNGWLWGLAREIHFADPNDPPPPGHPTYEEARDYYESRAYGLDLAWDWRGSQQEMSRYGGLIHESDERLREATIFGGVLAANHLLSATDAFVSARLGRLSGGALSGALRMTPQDPRRGRWALVLHIRS